MFRDPMEFLRRYGTPGRRTIVQLLGLRALGYGEEEKDIYMDYQGYGYKTQEDRDEGRNKMVKESADGKYYPQQYGT